MEWLTRWVTLGADPKVGFGINSFDAEVSTIRVRNPGDPRVTTQDSGVHFAPYLDLSLYARVHVRRNLTLTGGYQWLWARGISRPADNILYNDLGVGAANSAIVVDPSFGRMYWCGWNLGAEFRF